LECPETAKILLGDRNRILNPDLVFGDNEAVGDVKYRLTERVQLELRRSDTRASRHRLAERVGSWLTRSCGRDVLDVE
jgi:hypothetical protein